jgi:hypothetical protein
LNLKPRKQLFDLALARRCGEHARRRQNVGFDIEIFVFDLHRFQHNRGSRYDYREEDTEYQRNQDRSGDGFFSFSHERASV